MVRLVTAVLALALGVNDLAMLFAGLWWYGVVPGVTASGPFNSHFVRDIGAAYLVTAGGLGWSAWRSGGLKLEGLRTMRINGYPGLVLNLADGPETIAFQPGVDGPIEAVYMVRNPEKLAHIERADRP